MMNIREKVRNMSDNELMTKRSNYARIYFVKDNGNLTHRQLQEYAAIEREYVWRCFGIIA